MKLWLASAAVLVGGYALLALMFWFFWSWLLLAALVAVFICGLSTWQQNKVKVDGLHIVLEENLRGFELPIAMEARKIIEFPSSYSKIRSSKGTYSLIGRSLPCGI